MKKSIVHNLSLVLICSFVAKLLGGVYKIVLTRVLSTNIGLYQMVFSVYGFLVVLISSGIPLSISKLISGMADDEGRRKILKGAIAILVSVSAILALLLALGGKGISLLQGDGRLYLCYIILAPSLVLSACIAILKGYFQGVHNFNKPAVAGILEQVVKVALGLVFIIVLNRFVELGALIGAFLGTLLGDAIEFLFLWLSIKGKIGWSYKLEDVKGGIDVIKHSYPIMLYSLIIPFSNFIDSFLVVKLLELHLPHSTSTLLYGLQSGTVGALISIPSIFSFALASVLMPSLSEDYSKHRYSRFNQKVVLAFKMALCVAVPFAIYFAIYSGKIITLLYGSRINGYGVNGQYIARILLSISSLSIVFTCFNQIGAIILQNLDKKITPVVNLSIGMICKLAIQLMFIPSKRISIYAYAIAVVVGVVVSGVLNLYAVQRYSKNVLELKFLTKLFISSIILMIVLIIFKLFSSTFVFILGSIFAAAVYLISVYLLKFFSKKDFKFLVNNE